MTMTAKELEQRDQDAKVLAQICDGMNMPPNRVLVIAAHEMFRADPAHAIEALRRLADAFETIPGQPAGGVH